MLDFTGVKSITIPEGSVKKITSGGVVLWQLQTEEYPKEIFDASRKYTGHMSGTSITSSSNTMYVMSVDISQIPSGADVYVEIKGLYQRNTTSPCLEKIGYSALENPVVGSSQIIISYYAASSYVAIENIDGGCKIKVGYSNTAKHSSYNSIKTMLLEIKPAETHDPSTISVQLYYTTD